MDKEKTIKDYLDKIKLLEKYNKSYYDKDSPIVSDQKYDFLKKNIIDLENLYNFLDNSKSPTKTVGFTLRSLSLVVAILNSRRGSDIIGCRSGLLGVIVESVFFVLIIPTNGKGRVCIRVCV